MKKVFTSTYKKAEKLAKEILRERLNVKRLFQIFTKRSSIQCGCGESDAVIVDCFHDGNYFSQKVGVCKHCM